MISVIKSFICWILKTTKKMKFIGLPILIWVGDLM